uniref:NADH dehydrogenase subunit 2 n=1 Tax=Dipodomys spectabilis TaxID=105255 RepID=UPI00226CC5C2|nr:NADH dehydrogenase subunit 2 [Dipodomys spectabilis]UZH94528.1 NADH dehydrogenase subunit 2 [Dipodomys spectabilis]
MNTIAFILIMFTMILGTTITMTSSHWMLTWLGLEINMLSMIPLMTINKNPRSTEAASKYFLTQATASMILMFAITNNFHHSGQWDIQQPPNPLTSLTLLIALTMKLGLAPFHLWVPEVTQGIPLLSGLILLTWQKLAPISILYQLSPFMEKNLILSMSILSILLGGWGGLNQTQLRKIMAYSSIAHMGWMMAVMIYNPSTMILNLIIYIILTVTLFVSLNSLSITTTSSLTSTWNSHPLMTLATLLCLMSLGGLPPLTGFLPKWLIIQEMIFNDMIATSLTMAMMALLNLFFYMRLIYSTSLTLFPLPNNTKFKWHHPNQKTPTTIPTMLMISSFYLPLTPMITTMM